MNTVVQYSSVSQAQQVRVSYGHVFLNHTRAVKAALPRCIFNPSHSMHSSLDAISSLTLKADVPRSTLHPYTRFRSALQSWPTNMLHHSLPSSRLVRVVKGSCSGALLAFAAFLQTQAGLASTRAGMHPFHRRRIRLLQAKPVKFLLHRAFASGDFVDSVNRARAAAG